MVRLLNAAQVPHLQPHLCRGVFLPWRDEGVRTECWSTTPAGGGPGMAPCAPTTRKAVSPALAPELVERDKGLGRAWPQPDPISKEFERRPFV